MPSHHDYLWIVWINTLLHELGVPVPMLPTAMLAGASAAAQGDSPLSLIAAVVAGTLLGNAVWFQAGRLRGASVLKLLCRMSLSPDTCVARTEDTFTRWGWSSLVIGRFIPGVSLIAPPLAGALGMSWWRFLVLTAAGAAVWGVVAVGAGMVLAHQIGDVVALLSRYGWHAAAIAGAMLLGYVVWRWYVRAATKRATDVPRITVDELKAAIERGEAPLIVDVRGAATRQALAHRIAEASESSLDEILAGTLNLPRDRLIVVFCSCPNEASAAAAARRLIDAGYARARPLLGGLERWVASGYPTEPAAGSAFNATSKSAPAGRP